MNNTLQDYYSSLKDDEKDKFIICVHEAGHLTLQELFFPGKTLITEYLSKEQVKAANLDFQGCVERIPPEISSGDLKNEIKDILVFVGGKIAVRNFLPNAVNFGWDSDYFVASQCFTFLRNKLRPDDFLLDMKEFESIKAQFIKNAEDLASTLLSKNNDFITAAAIKLYKEKGLNNSDVIKLKEEYPLILLSEKDIERIAPKKLRKISDCMEKNSNKRNNEFISACYHCAGHLAMLLILYGPRACVDCYMQEMNTETDLSQNITSDLLIKEGIIENPIITDYGKNREQRIQDTIVGAIDYAGLEAADLFAPKASYVMEEASGEVAFYSLYSKFYEIKNIIPKNLPMKKRQMLFNKRFKKDKKLVRFFVREILKENENLVNNLEDFLEKNILMSAHDMKLVFMKSDINFSASKMYANFMKSYAFDYIEFEKYRKVIMGEN